MPFLKNRSDSPSSASSSSEPEPAPDAFQKLVEDLSAALGPSSGLDSDDVDPADIQRLMEAYVSNSEEWSRYALGDGSRTYTRNLVDEGNGKSNLVRIDFSHFCMLIIVQRLTISSLSLYGAREEAVPSMTMPMHTVS